MFIPSIDVSCYSFIFTITTKKTSFFFFFSFFFLCVKLRIDFRLVFSFRTIRPFISKKADERRRFIFYSIYGWGFSALLTSVTIFADTHPNLIPRVLRPEMGTISCFLSSKGNTDQFTSCIGCFKKFQHFE